MRTVTVLFLAAISLFGQFDVELADKYNVYSIPVNATINSGYVLSLAVPTDTSTDKRIYPVYLSVLCNVDTTVTIRKDASTNPTSTVATPVPMNTNIPAVFRYYTSSNVGTGTAATPTYNVFANQARNIALPGSMLPPGRTNNRNFSLHIGAATGTCAIAWWVGQQK